MILTSIAHVSASIVCVLWNWQFIYIFPNCTVPSAFSQENPWYRKR